MPVRFEKSDKRNESDRICSMKYGIYIFYGIGSIPRPNSKTIFVYYTCQYKTITSFGHSFRK